VNAPAIHVQQAALYDAVHDRHRIPLSQVQASLTVVLVSHDPWF
jgi:hypothetical protein